MNIYVMHDIRANTYMTPFFLPTDVHALRELKQAVNTEATNGGYNPFKENATDYNLLRIGIYDTDTGEIKATAHAIVANAATQITNKE